MKPRLAIVSPALSDANNGNWRTASRWQRILSRQAHVEVMSAWNGQAADALIALHAARSAASVERFRTAHPQGRIAVVLTGTDLYRDLAAGSSAVAASLDAADVIVALNRTAPGALPPAWRTKCRVILQSVRPLTPLAKPEGALRCVLVGHLRAEKDPMTAVGALGMLPSEFPVSLRLIGRPLDAAIAARLAAAMEADRRLHWTPGLPHGLARQAIRRAHLLLVPSRMEGGANVVGEAICSGTPVLGSRIDGNVGLLGDAYPGWFPAGDAEALSCLLRRALLEPAFLDTLGAAAAAAVPAFSELVEQDAVSGLLADLC